VNPGCLGCTDILCQCDLRTAKKTALKMRQGLRRCRNPFGICNLRNRPLMQVLVYFYTLACFKCSVGKNTVRSLYKASKNELQVPGMTILRWLSKSLITRLKQALLEV
jgi:hypothetical protein